MNELQITTTQTTTIDLSIETAAGWFCGLNDDQQCKFFVEIARIASGWPRPADDQWWFIGGHLRNCKCSTEEAREMIRGIASGMEHSNHGAEIARQEAK